METLYRLRPVIAAALQSARNTALWLHKPGTLPGLIIIGTQKAATTSLFATLAQHPALTPSRTKEVHFADRNWARGPDWYGRCFPKAALTFEATPNYLFFPHSALRIVEVVPKARLVAVLRDPVERACSHYHYERRRGGEWLALEAAFRSERARTDRDWARALAQPGYWSFALQHQSYLRRGLYAAQLARWEEVFPKNQILVLEDRELYAQPALTLARIQDFVGLSPEPNLTLCRENTGSYENRALDHCAQTFYMQFREDSARLAERYGECFSWLNKL